MNKKKEENLIDISLQQFEKVLTENNKKNLKEISFLSLHLINDRSFLTKELSKIFALNQMPISDSEKEKFIKNLKQLSGVKKHLLGILRLSINGKAFDKHIEFLIKKIKHLPATYKESILNDFNTYENVKESYYEADPLKDLKELKAFKNISKTLNYAEDIQIRYEISKLKQSDNRVGQNRI